MNKVVKAAVGVVMISGGVVLIGKGIEYIKPDSIMGERRRALLKAAKTEEDRFMIDELYKIERKLCKIEEAFAKVRYATPELLRAQDMYSNRFNEVEDQMSDYLKEISRKF